MGRGCRGYSMTDPTLVAGGFSRIVSVAGGYCVPVRVKPLPIYLLRWTATGMVRIPGYNSSIHKAKRWFSHS
jgi:hypothetical protein